MYNMYTAVFQTQSNSHAKYSNPLATVTLPTEIPSIHDASIVSRYQAMQSVVLGIQYLWF